MTKEEIIRLAREAGFDPHDMSCDFTCNLQEIERFAALVAAAEREACAAFLETGVNMAGLAGDPVLIKYTFELLTGCAAAIRARWNNER